MVVASVYYSRTGVTRAVSEFIVGWLAGRGLRVDVFELRALREYARPLHLNPRLIFDTLVRGFAEYGGDEGFKPDAYDLVFIGTPIWFGRPTPVIKHFINKHKGRLRTPVVCYTTSALNIKYSEKLRKYLEERVYNVVTDFSVTGGLEKSRRVVEEALEDVVRRLRASSMEYRAG